MICVIGVAALALAAYWLSGMRTMARMNKDKLLQRTWWSKREMEMSSTSTW